MSTLEPEATRYTLCAGSKNTQEWITADACAIGDTNSTYTSPAFFSPEAYLMDRNLLLFLIK